MKPLALLQQRFRLLDDPDQCAGSGGRETRVVVRFDLVLEPDGRILARTFDEGAREDEGAFVVELRGDLAFRRRLLLLEAGLRGVSVSE